MTSPKDQIRKDAAADESSGELPENQVAGAIEEDKLPDLQVELEDALREIDKFKDMALRAEAEVQNVRRRAERDVENAHKFGLEKFVANLLPVADSLEKAIEAVNQAQGIEDTAARQLSKAWGCARNCFWMSSRKRG